MTARLAAPVFAPMSILVSALVLAGAARAEMPSPLVPWPMPVGSTTVRVAVTVVSASATEMAGVVTPGRPRAAAGGAVFDVRSAADFAKPYPPGATLVIAPDTVIQGPVAMRAVGTAARPITITGGGRIKGTATRFSDALTVGSNTVVDGLVISDASRYGVAALRGTSNIIVRNNEITRVGIGVALVGRAGKVIGNYIHDLGMVSSGPKEVNLTDDHGANGVLVAGKGHEVAYNRFVTNRAPSHQYGLGGGCLALFGTTSGLHVHHNWCEDSAGFLEAGGRPGTEITDVTVSYNVALDLNDRPFLTPHDRPESRILFRNVRVHRNTIVATRAGAKAMGLIHVTAEPAPDAFSITDNIFSLNSGDSVYKRDGATRGGNVFHLRDTGTHLFNDWSMALGPGEALADPGFVDAPGADFRLRAESVALGKGAF